MVGVKFKEGQGQNGGEEAGPGKLMARARVEMV